MKDLFWNQQGMINCEKHAPMKDSDTWKWDKWKKISPRDREDIAHAHPELNALIECEICHIR